MSRKGCPNIQTLNRNKRWTIDEDAVLRVHYRDYPTHVFQESLGRSIASIHGHAYRLGLTNKEVPDLVITPEEAAWLACAIDSEGHLRMDMRTRTRINGGNLYVSEIQISNTCREFLERAMAIVGMGYIRRIRLSITPSTFRPHQPIYVYSIQGRFRVAAVLKAVYPFLIVKKERAALLIEAGEVPNKRLKDLKRTDFERLVILTNTVKRTGYGRGKYRPSEFDIIKQEYFL